MGKAVVPFSFDFLKAIITIGSEISIKVDGTDQHYRVVGDVPANAHVIDITGEPYTRKASLHLEHPDWADGTVTSIPVLVDAAYEMSHEHSG